jgi:ADP-ribose pyrophosphatase YjhB (NUDIX family)
MPRVQAIVVRDGRVLMVKHHHRGEAYWCLPGGALEPGETPEEGALRELGEECKVDGVIVRRTSFVLDVYAGETYTFLVDIGDQRPSLGHDPEFAARGEAPILVDVQWLCLSEIPERDRAFLWAAGLLGVGDFLDEVERWGGDTSYPGEERGGSPTSDDA